MITAEVRNAMRKEAKKRRLTNLENLRANDKK
jgi:hypothetical protein